MDGHPCGDTRQNPGYVGSRPLPGPATEAGLVVSGSSWHVGVSGIGISGIGAYRPTHVPTPSLLQLANRASHLLPTLTSHPESTQPSTDTHDSLSAGTTFYRRSQAAQLRQKTEGFSVRRRMPTMPTCMASMRAQPENRGSQRNPTVRADHPRARPTSHATVFVRDRPRAQPSSHRLVVLHTISSSPILRRDCPHTWPPSRACVCHQSQIERRDEHADSCDAPHHAHQLDHIKKHDETWSPRAAIPGHAVSWRIRASRL